MNFRLLLDIEVVEFIATLPRWDQVVLRRGSARFSPFPRASPTFRNRTPRAVRLMSTSIAGSPFTIGKTSLTGTSKCSPSAALMREGTTNEKFPGYQVEDLVTHLRGAIPSRGVGWPGSRAAVLAPGSPAPLHETQLPRAKTALPSPQLGNEGVTNFPDYRDDRNAQVAV